MTARNTSTSIRNSSSPSNVHPPITGRGTSWIPNAPRVRSRPIQEDVEADCGKAKGDEDEDVVPEPVEHNTHHNGYQARQDYTNGQSCEERPIECGYGPGAQLVV